MTFSVYYLYDLFDCIKLTGEAGSLSQIFNGRGSEYVIAEYQHRISCLYIFSQEPRAKSAVFEENPIFNI